MTDSSHALYVESTDNSSLLVEGTYFEAKLPGNHEHEAHRVAVAAPRRRARKAWYVRTVTPGALQGQNSIETFDVFAGLFSLKIKGGLKVVVVLVDVHIRNPLNARKVQAAERRSGEAHSIRGRAEFHTSSRTRRVSIST